MDYTTLGHSNLKISRIAFGCMSLKPDQEDATAIIKGAIDAGINYFDTADLYDKGLNEKLLGNALKGRRDKVVIATKVGNQWKEDGSGWDWNPSKAYIISSVDQSLQRLQTDYIDVYQLHGGTLEDPIDETIEAFETLVKQGKIRYYGISSIRPNVIREYVDRSNIISVMTQYSLLDRRPEEQTLELLKDQKIGVLARGTVASGLLVDKPAKAYLNRSETEVRAAAQAIQNLSKEGRSPAQTAIQFALSNPAITAAVVGIRTMEQLQDAIHTFDHPLTQEELQLLQQSVPANYYEHHR